MDDLTGIVVAATVAQMRAAAYAIARHVRDTIPHAARVHLHCSDQGDWLDVTGWDTGQDTDDDDLELHDLDLYEDGPLGAEVAFAAAHLYTPHIGNGRGVERRRAEMEALHERLAESGGLARLGAVDGVSAVLQVVSPLQPEQLVVDLGSEAGRDSGCGV